MLLVRGELAVLLARFVWGHGLAVWVAVVQQQQQKLEEEAAQVGGRNGGLSVLSCMARHFAHLTVT